MKPVRYVFTCPVLSRLQVHVQECRQYTGPEALDRLVSDVQHMVETLGQPQHDNASSSASRPPTLLQWADHQHECGPDNAALALPTAQRMHQCFACLIGRRECEVQGGAAGQMTAA